MRIVMLSDTHMMHEEVNLPSGDTVIHCGDFCSSGHKLEFDVFAEWFDRLPYANKILVAGNHDMYAEYNKKGIKDSLTDTIYLENEAVTIDGVTFWGSPVTQPFNEWAFNWNSEKRQALYDSIPDEIDVLITHGPPFSILDKDDGGYTFGCTHLREAVLRIKPQIHCFGHLHPSYGTYKDDITRTTFVNCSVVNDAYNVVNKPIVIKI
jgi:Icc-related predicted phosphoesterase